MAPAPSIAPLSSLAPSRRLQIGCAIVALIGFAPWALMFSGTVLHAIESDKPLAMSVAAWLVLLVPVWVIWFGLVAWRDRDASTTPAVLMALPAVLITGFGMVLPLAAMF